MKIYADSSFLVKLLVPEPGSDETRAEYQRMGRPQFPFLSLHSLEVATAIRQQAFVARASQPGRVRSDAVRIRDEALARLARWRDRGLLAETVVDWERALEVACDLSQRHVDRTGVRSLDLLHVAVAIELQCQTVLTLDRLQAKIARAEGLTVPEIQD